MQRITLLLEDAVVWRNFALFNIFTYIILWVIAEFTGWVHDDAFISRLSLLALILSSLSWWQSSRVEVKQQTDADVDEVLTLLREMKDAKDNDPAN